MFRITLLTISVMTCLATWSPGQGNADKPTVEELLQRISVLESQAKDRDARVVELESRLRDADAPSAIETLINDLERRGFDEAGFTVETRRATRLVIGGQLRFQAESRDIKNYGAGVDENIDFVIQRTRLNFDFQVTENVRTFVEIQDVGARKSRP